MESTKDTNNKNTSPFKFVLTNEGKIFLCSKDLDVTPGQEIVGFDFTEAVEDVIAKRFIYRMLESKIPMQESTVEIPGSNMYLLVRAELRPVDELNINTTWQTDLVQ